MLGTGGASEVPNGRVRRRQSRSGGLMLARDHVSAIHHARSQAEALRLCVTSGAQAQVESGVVGEDGQRRADCHATSLSPFAQIRFHTA